MFGLDRFTKLEIYHHWKPEISGRFDPLAADGSNEKENKNE